MDGIQPGGDGDGDGDEPSSDDEDEDTLPPQAAVIVVGSRNRRESRRVRQTPVSAISNTSGNNAIPASTPSLQRAHSLSTLTSLPSSIWVSPWAPQRGPYNVDDDMGSLKGAVYDTATHGINGIDLHIHGKDVAELVGIIRQLINDAIDSNDFMRLLSPDRSFNL